LRSWWHLGQAAICVAGELKLASATTFTGVPHLQHHNATSLAMLPPATIVALLASSPLRTNRKAYSVRYFGLKSVAVISDWYRKKIKSCLQLTVAPAIAPHRG